MKFFKIVLLLTLPICVKAKWHVTDAYLKAGNNDTVLLKLTAYSDGVYNTSSGFTFRYYKTYLLSDTLVVRPYYFESQVGSGFKYPVTINTELNLGVLTDGVAHICVEPYDLFDIDTTVHPPTHNPPNSCMAVATVSIKQHQLENNEVIKVYPNPVEDVLYITSRDRIKEFSVYSVSGQLMLHTLTPEKNLNVSHLSPGLYVLKVTTVQGVLYRRFTKE